MASPEVPLSRSNVTHTFSNSAPCRYGAQELAWTRLYQLWVRLLAGHKVGMAPDESDTSGPG